MKPYKFCENNEYFDQAIEEHPILILDDEKDTLKKLSRMVSSIGYKTINTFKGSSAIIKASRRAGQPGSTLLDIVLKGQDIDGLYAAAQIKGKYPSFDNLKLTH
ncbi:MAG: hypothetical protein KJ971_07605 [Firmicutes bacterium]|nr:hypothetical protein [Bacillota bacterium]